MSDTTVHAHPGTAARQPRSRLLALAVLAVLAVPAGRAGAQTVP